jgi:MFS family permease
LFAIFWLNLVVQVVYIAFSPIATVSASYYDVGLTAINWLSLLWLILFTPFTFLAGWAFEKYGIRNCLIAAATGLTLATLVRCLSLAVGSSQGVKDNAFAYITLVLGSLIAATVQPIILASTTLMASTWFSVQQRNLANTVVRTLSCT